MRILPGARSLSWLVLVLALTGTRRRAQAGEVPQGDAAAGAKSFLVCSACHTTTEGGAALIGPNLWHVVGTSGREQGRLRLLA